MDSNSYQFCIIFWCIVVWGKRWKCWFLHFGRLFLNAKSGINPLSTTTFVTPFLIGSCHEIFTYMYLVNYDKTLKMLHIKLAYETIFFSYTSSDWFTKWYNIHSDQPASSSHGLSITKALTLNDLLEKESIMNAQQQYCVCLC